MQQIADWLNQLGMSEYAERFVESDIDIDVLSELTDQDFDRLGVSLGHRRRMLRAIRELGASPIAAVTERQVSAPTAQEPAPKDTAERRQVTVMFSDLVGSTALSARMDPEDLREVISAYQKYVAETVRRFDGFVAKYMGDGVLAYFGYPQAHEDDAERAVRAGLELSAAVSALKAPVSLQTRVGIATGLVVVGDLIGSGEAQERGIVGDTPNLAARLQALADTDAVVIGPKTRQIIGDLFEYGDLGTVECRRQSRASRTSGCATSARPTTRAAPCTRSPGSSNTQPASRTTTRPGRSSTNWRPCSRRPRRPPRTWRSSPSCCRSRPAIAILPWISPCSAKRRGRWRRCFASSKAWRGTGRR